MNLWQTIVDVADFIMGVVEDAFCVLVAWAVVVALVWGVAFMLGVIVAGGAK